MTDKLRPDELEAFKAAFDMFDKNSDGTISTKVSPSLLEHYALIPLKSSSSKPHVPFVFQNLGK